MEKSWVTFMVRFEDSLRQGSMVQMFINVLKENFMAIPKRRNSVTDNGNSVDGKRKTKRWKFRTKRRKLLKISVKFPKKRNFFS
jgi:hypothetical protein